MVRVLVDSSADYEKEELIAKNIEFAPLTITVGDSRSYRDVLELTRAELYDFLINGKETVKTSQPSPQSFVEIFEKVKVAGDEIVCIMLSSTLSGTYQSAILAKEIVDYDKIYVVDSLSATVAIKIMADYALELGAKGVSGKEIAEEMEALKGRLRITACVDTLKYLWLGGRVSRTTAVVADTVNIKPGIVVTKEGAVGVTSKYLGVTRAVKDLVKQMKNADIDRNFPFYLIYSHDNTNCMKLKKALEAADIKVDNYYELGATLGVHVGPGAFGCIYVAK